MHLNILGGCTFERFEVGDLGWRILETKSLPASADRLVDLFLEQGSRRERVDILELHAGVDDAFRSPRPDFRWIQTGIEVRAPGLAQYVD